MNKRIMLMLSLLALPLGILSSNPVTAQAKIHYVHTPKALRGHYHGVLTDYSAPTYVIHKKTIEIGVTQADSYPDGVTKVKKYKLFRYAGHKIHAYRLRAKASMGGKRYYEYIAYHYTKNGKYITIGHSWKQLKKHLKRPNMDNGYSTNTFKKGKLSGYGYNY